MSALVCAHRGASIDHVDNTYAAFVAAIASGADLIETDVRMTPDGRLVLAHDTWDLDRDDLCDLDTLLDLAAGQIGLDLEIVEVGLERALLDLVDGFPGRLLVTSVFPDVLATVAGHAAHIEIGLVVEAPYDGSAPLDDPLELTAACGASVCLVEDAIASADLVHRAAERGMPLWIWTVNDEPRLRELLTHPDVAGVITDDPALACRLVASATDRRG